ALDRLAQLDSAQPLPLGQILVAESDDSIYAALSMVDGRVIADPFHRTAELVGMLVERSRQLESVRRRRRFYARDFTLATNPRTDPPPAAGGLGVGVPQRLLHVRHELRRPGRELVIDRMQELERCSQPDVGDRRLVAADEFPAVEEVLMERLEWHRERGLGVG